MKTPLLILFTLLLTPTVFAQVNNHYSLNMGLNWLLQPTTKYSFGIQHEYNSFAVKYNHVGHSGTNNNYFHTFNVNGSIKPHKRVQILINLPIHYYVQQTDNGKRELANPGDVSILSQYQLLRTNDSTKKIMKHSLTAGVGIKLPTGRYNMYDETGFYDRYMQPGTGSWDVLLNSQYVIKWGQWGLNTHLNAKISTQGADNYLYGHTLNTGVKAFYWGKGETVSVLASGGLQYNYGSKDVFMRQYQPTTGGHLLAANVNADFYIKKFIVGIDVKLPVYSYLGGGDVKQGPLVTTQLIAMF